MDRDFIYRRRRLIATVLDSKTWQKAFNLGSYLYNRYINYMIILQVKFDKISFRPTENEKRLLQYLQQKVQAKTPTELMHALISEYQRMTGFVQAPQNEKSISNFKKDNNNTLALQDYPFFQPNDPFLQIMLTLERQREQREARERERERLEERAREQRIEAEKRAEASRQMQNSNLHNNKAPKTLTDLMNEKAAFLEAWNRFKRSCRGF
jgi:hypothetical protein